MTEEEFEHRWGRASVLVGVAFVIALVAQVVLASNSLSPHAGGQAVLKFYQDNRARVGVGSALIMTIVVLGVFFYGMLADYLRRDPANGPLARVAFGGALIFGAGGAIGEGMQYTLSYSAHSLDASAAQALYNGGQASQALQGAGVATLALATAIAILRTGVLPKWLGWVGAVIGVLSLLPGPAGGIGFLSAGIWTLALSITMYVQLGHHRSRAAVPTTVAHA